MSLRSALDAEKQTDIGETAKLLNTLSPKQLAKRELAMLNLCVNEISWGFGGRTMLELGPDKAIGIFEPCVTVGDIVHVTKQPLKSTAPGGIAGVVAKVTKTSVVVACSDLENDIPDGRLWLLKLVPETVYDRMNWAIGRFDDGSKGRLIDIVKGDAQGVRVSLVDDFKPLSPLNEPQIQAVRSALGSEVCVIHGPPGTGKTMTVVEIVRQLVAKGERVLVCGPSNISVDNIVLRLSPHLRRVLRLGHPVRQLEAVAAHSLDLIITKTDEGRILKDIQTEIAQILAQVKKARGSSRRTLWTELKQLREDYRAREKNVVRSMILNSNVVACTLHGAGAKYVGSVVNSMGGKPLFDTIIIDEVSQAQLAQCYIPLVIEPNAQRLVIAGDNKQLPPTIKSQDREIVSVLERTLFDELVAKCGPKVKQLISVQYRMPQEIMEFPSNAMYSGQLIADKSVAKNRLYDLPHVERNDTTESVVLWVDTLGERYPEQQEEDSLSHKNIGEAELLANYAVKLFESGVKNEDIGVISPYHDQVVELQNLLPNLEVSTVDGFQGREKEVILMSLVRSNSDKNVGFVADARRMNVAITRAKRQLVIFGDSDTIGSQKGFLKDWVDWCQDNADIEYADSY